MGRKKQSLADKIRKHIGTYPKEKASDTALKFNVSVPYVYTLRSQVRKAQKTWQTVAVMSSSEPLPITMEESPADVVNHPAHYKVGGIETIDFIEAKNLNYNIGNVVKYLTRADHKGNRRQDLEKAMWYLKREIEKPHQPA
jgi:hypothetical protein